MYLFCTLIFVTNFSIFFHTQKMQSNTISAFYVGINLKTRCGFYIIFWLIFEKFIVFMQNLQGKKGAYVMSIKREEAAKENCLRSFHMTIRMCACHIYSYNENVARPFFSRDTSSAGSPWAAWIVASCQISFTRDACIFFPEFSFSGCRLRIPNSLARQRRCLDLVILDDCIWMWETKLIVCH